MRIREVIWRLQHARGLRVRLCSALAVICLLLMSAREARATIDQSFTEGFNDVSMLTGAGWVMTNLSSPPGSTDWFQGNAVEFPAQSGMANSYIAASFNNAGFGMNAIISNWLISPPLDFNNGDTISFWTRSSTPAGNTEFADRLQFRLSTNGASANVGATATSVGDFTQLLLDINSTYSQMTIYPDSWTRYEVTLMGLSGKTQGRFAFRYFVENGGPDGERSNYIGIDTLEYNAIPEPASLAMLALPLLLLRRRHRR